jgi:protease IV
MTSIRKISFSLALLLALNLNNCISFFSVLPIGKTGFPNLEEVVIQGKDDDKIAMISINGVISDETRESFFGIKSESPISVIKENLKRAQEDKDVKAVILKINSPGGTVTASDIIYHEIMEFKRKSNKPVMTIFVDVGASGAYYIAMATDIVTAHPTSVTGSIGVVLQGINVKEGLDKIGVKDQSITSGNNKAIGSPLQELGPEQRGILQGIVNSMYERFFDVVKKGRPKMTESQLKPLCDGRIFTGVQAKKLGLVDHIGYFEDLVPQLMRHGNYIKRSNNDQPRIITYTRGSGKVENIYQANLDQNKENLLEKIITPSSTAKFFYLWSL